jgi:replication-associated recombination protein RarA
MNTVYILSGPPRTAKTTIMNSLIAETKVQLIAADAIEHGLRNVLTGQPHQMLGQTEINGFAEH